MTGRAVPLYEFVGNWSHDWWRNRLHFRYEWPFGNFCFPHSTDCFQWQQNCFVGSINNNLGHILYCNIHLYEMTLLYGDAHGHHFQYIHFIEETVLIRYIFIVLLRQCFADWRRWLFNIARKSNRTIEAWLGARLVVDLFFTSFVINSLGFLSTICIWITSTLIVFMLM